MKAEKLKIDEKNFIKNLSITEINKAKAKKDAEQSILNIINQKKIGLRNYLKIKLLLNQS